MRLRCQFQKTAVTVIAPHPTERVAAVPISHHQWQSAVLCLKKCLCQKKNKQNKTKNVPLLLRRSAPFWISVRVADFSEKIYI